MSRAGGSIFNNYDLTTSLAVGNRVVVDKGKIFMNGLMYDQSAPESVMTHLAVGAPC